MPAFSAETVVAAPTEAVFAIVSDLSTHPSWAADDLTMHRTGESTWRSVSLAKGRRFHADIIVTASTPHRSFEFIATDETGTYRHRFALEPSESGCRVERLVSAERLRPVQLLWYWLTLVPVRRPALETSLQRLGERLG